MQSSPKPCLCVNTEGWAAKGLFADFLLVVKISTLYLGYHQPNLGLYSQNGKTSYRQILRSLEAASLDVVLVVSLSNVLGISAAVFPMCLSNYRTIGNLNVKLAASILHEISL